MTPHRADLFDEVERQNLGVEVANGHVIKCSVSGKIQLQMTDDNGSIIETVFHDVIYVPRLRQRLFFITRFVTHGHVTLTYEGSQAMAADATVVSSEAQPHLVPSHWSHDHSANKWRTGLKLLHLRLGHWKCRALIAVSEHGVWSDTIVCMGPEKCN